MIRSMTGYGTSRSDLRSGSVSAEVKSWNHKGLDLQFRLPAAYLHLETPLRARVSPIAGRGKVTVTVVVRGNLLDHDIRINEPMIESVMAAVGRVAKSLALPISFSTQDAFAIPGAIEIEERPSTDTGAAIEDTIAAAVAAWDQSRIREGGDLHNALTGELDALDTAARDIEAAVALSADTRRDRWRAKIAELIAGNEGKIDQSRIELELAMMAERADVREEIVRLYAHLNAARKLIGDIAGAGSGETNAMTCGAEFGFLLQELLREANTISSKSQDLGIVQAVLAAKKAIDRMKEQAANVV